MITENYHYFLKIVEFQNISKAGETSTFRSRP